MKFCPKCGYKVYPEDTFCKICLLPLNKGQSAKKSKASTRHGLSAVVASRLASFLGQNIHVILVLAGLAVIAYGVTYYTSPLVRMERSGIRLQHNPSSQGPIQYLVGDHCTTKSWAYRGATMDTPLISNEVTETGTLAVTSSIGPQTGQTIHIKAEEWVKMAKTGDNAVNQTIPANHPSIAPGSVIMDSQGSVLERRNDSSPRLGRAMHFIFPLFPKGTQHPGSSWTEHIAWEEPIGEWQIAWDAVLVWELKDFEACYGTTCAKLMYQGTLRPHIVRAPSWTAKGITDISFEGRSTGEALYNTRDKIVIGNSHQYAGKLSIQIPNLQSIPEEQRVGYSVPEEPGTVVIQFSNKFDIQKPT